MANDTQNPSEGRPSRNHLFGLPVVIDEGMPNDAAALVSYTWDAAKEKMVELDRVTIRNLG